MVILWWDNIWPRYNYLKIWNLRVKKKLNIEKIAFKVVHMTFLAMYITKQKLRFDIFTVENVQNIFTEPEPCNVLFAIATNIPVLLMTGFVV